MDKAWPRDLVTWTSTAKCICCSNVKTVKEQTFYKCSTNVLISYQNETRTFWFCSETISERLSFCCTVPATPLIFLSFDQGSYPRSAPSGGLLVHYCFSWSLRDKVRGKLRGPLLLSMPKGRTFCSSSKRAFPFYTASVYYLLSGRDVTPPPHTQWQGILSPYL